MARPLRIEFEGALYHVTARGDRGEPIFQDDTDRQALLRIVAQALERFDAAAFAYCLMGNHYHLVVQTRGANLSRLMRHVNGVYTQYFNRRHDQTGHLFQGRFKAVLVDEEAYFLAVCRYVERNPVRAGLVAHAQDWAWSSYRAHTGLAAGPAWLDSAEVHRRMAPRAPRRDGAMRYAEFVSGGRDASLWSEALVGQIYLGSEAFAERMRHRSAAPASVEVPRAQRCMAGGQTLDSYLAGDRDEGIWRAYRDGGFTQTSIAAATGLSASRVSRLISHFEAKGKT